MTWLVITGIAAGLVILFLAAVRYVIYCEDRDERNIWR